MADVAGVVRFQRGILAVESGHLVVLRQVYRGLRRTLLEALLGRGLGHPTLLQEIRRQFFQLTLAIGLPGVRR